MLAVLSDNAQRASLPLLNTIMAISYVKFLAHERALFFFGSIESTHTTTGAQPDRKSLQLPYVDESGAAQAQRGRFSTGVTLKALVRISYQGGHLPYALESSLRPSMSHGSYKGIRPLRLHYSVAYN